MTAPTLLQSLFAHAGLVAQPGAEPERIVAEFRPPFGAPEAAWLGELVVPDSHLAEVSRVVAAHRDPLPVCVVNTSGAGGLLALARRALPGLELVAVVSALRDLDDLAGNAARLVAAAGELGDDMDVYVEIPLAAGWWRAVERAEEGGLLGAVRWAGPGSAAGVVEQLGAFVEADLGFRVNGSPAHPLGVLRAVLALVEGARPEEVAPLLLDPDSHHSGDAVGGWDDVTVARVRRRLRRLECASVASLGVGLAALGLSGATDPRPGTAS